MATLKRGYAVVQDADGHVVTSVAGTAVDQPLSVRVYDGRLGVVVAETEPIPTDEENDA
jgi:exodeoxyribonuclease VII large subunit